MYFSSSTWMRPLPDIPFTAESTNLPLPLINAQLKTNQPINVCPRKLQSLTSAILANLKMMHVKMTGEMYLIVVREGALREIHAMRMVLAISVTKRRILKRKILAPHRMLARPIDAGIA